MSSHPKSPPEPQGRRPDVGQFDYNELIRGDFNVSGYPRGHSDRFLPIEPHSSSSLVLGHPTTHPNDLVLRGVGSSFSNIPSGHPPVVDTEYENTAGALHGHSQPAPLHFLLRGSPSELSYVPGPESGPGSRTYGSMSTFTAPTSSTGAAHAITDRTSVSSAGHPPDGSDSGHTEVTTVALPQFKPGLSRDWTIPRKIRRPRKPSKGQQNAVPPDHICKPKSSQRKPFTPAKREGTAKTRIRGACPRCVVKKIRCEPSNIDEDICQACVPFYLHVGCLQLKPMTFILYRHQDGPSSLFTRRWPKFVDLEKISFEWDSPDIKTVLLTPVFPDPPPGHQLTLWPLAFKVRRFVPRPGDKLGKEWISNGTAMKHQSPPYALCDLKGARQTILDSVDCDISNYICYTLPKPGLPNSTFLWETYGFAFKYIGMQSEKRRQLLADVFRFWKLCRVISNSQQICGQENLGTSAVSDPNSRYYKRVPTPPMFTVLQQMIIFPYVLEPLSGSVRKHLLALIRENDKENWLTIYLAIFILLHNCSMMAKRNRDTARQYSVQREYMNPDSMERFDIECKTLLAFFHGLTRGPLFTEIDDNTTRDAMAGIVQHDYELDFIKKTAYFVKRLFDANCFDSFGKEYYYHDLHWVFQLYNPPRASGP